MDGSGFFVPNSDLIVFLCVRMEKNVWRKRRKHLGLRKRVEKTTCVWKKREIEGCNGEK